MLREREKTSLASRVRGITLTSHSLGDEGELERRYGVMDTQVFSPDFRRLAVAPDWAARPEISSSGPGKYGSEGNCTRLSSAAMLDRQLISALGRVLLASKWQLPSASVHVTHPSCEE